MTTFARAYFSFLQLSDSTAHRRHNDWHQLTHLPENRLLPGIAWGERWVRSPGCAAASVACSSDIDGTEYVTMYLLRAEHEASTKAFMDLGAHTLQTGDRPELEWWGPHVGGPFVPIRGYVSPEVRVSAEALPARPGGGLHLVVRDVPADADVNALYRAIDTTVVPASLAVPGVAGAWTFVDEAAYLPFPSDQTTRRITMYFVDGDPIAIADRLNEVEADLGARFPSTSLAMSGPLLTITPHEWDWFD